MAWRALALLALLALSLQACNAQGEVIETLNQRARGTNAVALGLSGGVSPAACR